MTNLSNEGVRQSLATLRLDLGARAAGYWWLAGEWLEQVAFAPSPALAEDVAQRFAEATRSVAMSAGTDLGIVKAALTDSPVVSIASGLPGETGSGYWLRAFEATRSVAVPLHDTKGAVRAIVSVALADGGIEDQVVVDQILAAVREWAPLV